MLTTLSPPRHGLTGYEACYLSESLTSLPEVLQREGWTTAAVSTNPLVRVDKGFDQGFESFEEMPWARASEVTARASEWLRENAHRRFALYLHYTDPHEYKPDAAFHEAWVGAPPKGYTIVRARQQLDRFLRGQSHDLDELRADAGHLSELYDATVAEVDAGIGGLLDELAALGLDENTVVVVTSDHGEAFFEHQRLFHSNSLHAEMVHVPLILWGPGVDAGQQVGEPVENRFVANTVLDLLGVRAPADYEGPDLLDVRERATRDGEPLFFTTSLGIWSRRGEHPELVGAKIHGVRTAAELYWFTPDAGRPAEAYFDLRVDPLAQVDVVEDHPRRAAALRDRIEAWLQEESSRCPIVVEGGQSAVELLQAHGYVGDDED